MAGALVVLGVKRRTVAAITRGVMDHVALAADLKVLAHPDRLRVLEAIDAGARGAKDVADCYGARVPAIAHHVGVLARAGLIELVGVRPVRGALARDYALTARGAVLLAWLRAR